MNEYTPTCSKGPLNSSNSLLSALMSTEPLSFMKSIEVPDQQIIYFLTELFRPENDSNPKMQHVAITGIAPTTYFIKTDQQFSGIPILILGTIYHGVQ